MFFVGDAEDVHGVAKRVRKRGGGWFEN